jgi:hypothetical protein
MNRMTNRLAAAVLAAVALGACAPYSIAVKETPGLDMPGKFKFRMNYNVHDDLGRNITDEIMTKHLDHWLTFTELSGAVRATLEDRGYQWMSDPTEPADFIMDVCFTAFYFDKVTDEQLREMKPATLLAGRSGKNGTFTHMIVITASARAPELASDKWVTLWEARGIATDKNADIRMSGFPMVADMITRFPKPEPR